MLACAPIARELSFAMPTRFLIAPDKFKGSLSAVAVVAAISRGWSAVFPEDTLEAAPIADGGEGFAEALCLALGGEWIQCTALDPIGREIRCEHRDMSSPAQLARHETTAVSVPSARFGHKRISIV